MVVLKLIEIVGPAIDTATFLSKLDQFLIGLDVVFVPTIGILRALTQQGVSDGAHTDIRVVISTGLTFQVQLITASPRSPET